MNKMLNSVIFVIVATAVNVAIMLVLLIFGFFIVGRLASMGTLPDALIQVLSIFTFIGSIIGSFLGYSRLLRWYATKVDMEKYFHPLLKPKDKNN